MFISLFYTNQDKQVICVANQNGSQADCELGNPFKRDSEVGPFTEEYITDKSLICVIIG